MLLKLMPRNFEARFKGHSKRYVARAEKKIPRISCKCRGDACSQDDLANEFEDSSEKSVDLEPSNINNKSVRAKVRRQTFVQL